MKMSGFPPMASSKDRVSCEVNRIGATRKKMAKPLQSYLS